MRLARAKRHLFNIRPPLGGRQQMRLQSRCFVSGWYLDISLDVPSKSWLPRLVLVFRALALVFGIGKFFLAKDPSMVFPGACCYSQVYK
jgi:hypothetical protein